MADNINDIKFVYLRAQGYKGTLNDMEHSYYGFLFPAARSLSLTDLRARFLIEEVASHGWKEEIDYWNSL